LAATARVLLGRAEFIAATGVLWGWAALAAAVELLGWEVAAVAAAAAALGAAASGGAAAGPVHRVCQPSSIHPLALVDPDLEKPSIVLAIRNGVAVGSLLRHI
jgi:hypothetical protein